MVPVFIGRQGDPNHPDEVLGSLKSRAERVEVEVETRKT